MGSVVHPLWERLVATYMAGHLNPVHLIWMCQFGRRRCPDTVRTCAASGHGHLRSAAKRGKILCAKNDVMRVAMQSLADILWQTIAVVSNRGLHTHPCCTMLLTAWSSLQHCLTFEAMGFVIHPLWERLIPTSVACHLNSVRLIWMRRGFRYSWVLTPAIDPRHGWPRSAAH